MMDLWLFSGMKLRTKFDTIKFNLNDFIALDVEGLLAVNGGSGCGSSSGSSNPSSDSGSGNS